MRLVDAIAPLEKALTFDSTNVDLLANYALALAQVGRVSEGLDHARRARDMDPLYVSANGIYGYMLDMSGRLDEAVALTRAAVDLDPENVLARRGLGRLYAFAGLPDSAVAQFERAFSIDSTIFGGRTNLMFGYAATGRWDDVARQRALLARERVGNSPNYYRMMVSLVRSNRRCDDGVGAGGGEPGAIIGEHEPAVRPDSGSAQAGPAFRGVDGETGRPPVSTVAAMADRTAASLGANRTLPRGQRPERTRRAADRLRGIGDRRDLPACRRSHQRERVHTAVHELTVAMDVVRRPHDGEWPVHEHRRLPHALDVRIAHGGELGGERLERSVRHRHAVAAHASGVLNAVGELHATQRGGVASGHGVEEVVHGGDDGVARCLCAGTRRENQQTRGRCDPRESVH
jgi:hypothetical protein